MRVPLITHLSSLLLILLIQSLVADNSSSSADLRFSDTYDGMLGVRAGTDFGAKYFRSFESFVSLETAHQWIIRDSWAWRFDMEGALGVLQRRGVYGVLANAGPVLAFEPTDARWGLRIGFAPTLISRDEYGKVDLGGHLQFSSSVTALWRFNPNCSMLYRFQHTSNGGLRPSNPGLDLHSLGFAYHF